MRKFSFLMLVSIFIFVFTGCIYDKGEVINSSGTNATEYTEIAPDTTEKVSVVTSEIAEATTELSTTEYVEETESETIEPVEALFHIDGVSVDDIITYFNEVVLDSEFENSGDSTLLQKWTIPIKYIINGETTADDNKVLLDFVAYLNTIEGFPGMYEVYDEADANLNIYFCTGDELVEKMGENTNYEMLDGAVTFWYDDNEINSGIICYRNDIEQETRNSVIIEEIYNGLGPIQDTDIRVDSIIYSGFSTPQKITEVDDVILRLLYHPDMKCSMNVDECEEVIKKLYY